MAYPSSRRRVIAVLAALAVSLTLVTFAGPASIAEAKTKKSSAYISTPAQTSVGNSITISVKVKPAAKAKIRIQFRYVGASSWKTVKTAYTSKKGTYSRKLSVTDDRDRDYRVLISKHGKYRAATSATVRVVVDPATSTTPTDPAQPASLKVSSFSPATGSITGWYDMTIAGTGVGSASSVTFQSLGLDKTGWQLTGMPQIDATILARDLSADTVTVRVPANLAGKARITVNAGSESAIAPSNFVYTVDDGGETTYQASVVAEINTWRAAGTTCGTSAKPAVGPLTWEGRLGSAATAHSRDLVQRYPLYQGLTHVTAGLTTWSARLNYDGFTIGNLGETIADMSAGHEDATHLVAAWMASTEHCKILMDADYTRIGVGSAVRQDSDTGTRTTITADLFGP
jgi:uncharacterized protein YkwD